MGRGPPDGYETIVYATIRPGRWARVRLITRLSG